MYRDILSLRCLLFILRTVFGELNEYDERREFISEVRSSIENALEVDVIVILAKLFDPEKATSTVHLKRLVIEVASRKPESSIAAKKSDLLKQMLEIHKRLEPLRNTDRVHNKPLKPDPYPPRTWKDIHEWTNFAWSVFEEATQILEEYWDPVDSHPRFQNLQEEAMRMRDALKTLMDQLREEYAKKRQPQISSEKLRNVLGGR